MSHKNLFNTTFHEALFRFDLAEANRVCVGGCPYCGGALHQAHFPRKSFGISAKHRHFYDRRFSFCCVVCRRRTTTPSLRFMAKIRFVSSVFILLSALRMSVSDAHCGILARRFGVRISPSTLQRWRSWWRQLPNTTFWRHAKSRLPTLTTILPVSITLARTLLKQFIGADLPQRLILLLRFLSPLSLQQGQVM